VLVLFLLENSDVFVWEPSDLSGIPREVIEHHLAVCPEARPVKQKVLLWIYQTGIPVT
jgi:hypothetical protein